MGHEVCTVFIDKFPREVDEPDGYGEGNGIPVRVVRDSGASISFVNSKYVKRERYTGERLMDHISGR